MRKLFANCMKNKQTFIILGIFFLIYIIGGLLYIFDNPLGWLVFDIGLIPGFIVGLILLIKNGTIISTMYLKLILVFIMLTLVGTFFKVSHWPFGLIIQTGSLLSIGLIYLIWFINKKDKKLLDILKLLWVITTSVLASLIGLSLIPSFYAHIGLIVFLVTITDYYIVVSNTEIIEIENN